MRKLQEIYTRAEEGSCLLAVVAAEDENILKAVSQAKKDGIAEPLLFGDQEKITSLLDQLGLPKDMEIIHAQDPVQAAEKAMEAVAKGEADLVMKGLVDTAVILKALLDKRFDLRDKALLSHMMIYEMESYGKLLGLTDGGMLLQPDYDQKKAILENGLEVFKALGYDEVKVAGLAAKEKVNEKMQATVDARRLQEEVREEGLVFEGPLALDLIFSKEAAKTKNFSSQIAGEVDFILVPSIETGNALGKSFTYAAGAESAGIIMGAKIPLVLVSRADSMESKLYSIALGKCIARHKKESK